jgi:FlaA1/EpsC-like NDP-sugar epimerase
MLNDKSILITGGTGSFGKKATKIILEKYKPSRLIIFSRDELKQFEFILSRSTNAYAILSVMSEIKKDYTVLSKE